MAIRTNNSCQGLTWTYRQIDLKALTRLLMRFLTNAAQLLLTPLQSSTYHLPYLDADVSMAGVGQ
jgi:hypothetical protein